MFVLITHIILSIVCLLFGLSWEMTSRRQIGSLFSNKNNSIGARDKNKMSVCELERNTLIVALSTKEREGACGACLYFLWGLALLPTMSIERLPLKSIWFHSPKWKYCRTRKSYNKTLSPHDLFILERALCLVPLKIEHLIPLFLYFSLWILFYFMILDEFVFVSD